MTKFLSIGLHWFNHDLRLDDNPALFEVASTNDRLICLFVVDPRWFKSSHYQSAHMGSHRWHFLLNTLRHLDVSLQAHGQKLHVMVGDPLRCVMELVEQYEVNTVSTNIHSGLYERQQWQRLKNYGEHLRFIEGQGHSLFNPEQLPFSVNDLPATFTPFRKHVEALKIDRPIRSKTEYPPIPNGFTAQWSSNLPIDKVQSSEFSGGEQSALRQLNYYLFETDLIQSYKSQRNGLDGWDFSSKLSAWLANGSISAKQVAAAIARYEKERVQNESTYWLRFELLWREFFYWYARKHGGRLFQLAGVQQKRPLTSFWPQRFARWCAGNTPYPIVNDCMKQLNATGYMSNRGRQLVASCLVHELGLDWRYGAAYFEQQLIDFDVASNYGNWQYLAGVGADPRGHRRFDLEKQTQQYDPNNEFIRRWDGHASSLPLDDVDPSDWPINWQ